MMFDNKVVLITGSGSGVGAAAAILFAEAGADVVIVDYSEERANNTAEKCNEFGKTALVIVADVSKNADAKQIIKQTIDTYGKLDVLVNNAGTARDEGSILDEKIMDTYDVILNTNLRAVVHMTSLAAPYLLKTKGCIVNTSSITSTAPRTASKYSAYCVSKAGIDTFTRSAAIQLAPSGIRVNAVNPGPVRTNILVHSGIAGDWDDMNELTALKKCSDPKEIADLIMYLASDKAKSITGACYIIDNGIGLM